MAGSFFDHELSSRSLISISCGDWDELKILPDLLSSWLIYTFTLTLHYFYTFYTQLNSFFTFYTQFYSFHSFTLSTSASFTLFNLFILFYFICLRSWNEFPFILVLHVLMCSLPVKDDENWIDHLLAYLHRLEIGNFEYHGDFPLVSYQVF